METCGEWAGSVEYRSDAGGCGGGDPLETAGLHKHCRAEAALRVCTGQLWMGGPGSMPPEYSLKRRNVGKSQEVTTVRSRGLRVDFLPGSLPFPLTIQHRFAKPEHRDNGPKVGIS
ncbi:hypothetical protein NDU88_006741 [Pleurodeles waltl]|uniref:Uncharacterized protein n=1 Tax=Pleurodeles waltl TaxID=8319 RepID=A0AAV7N040_PLEWA|nr:hypothetical protein NDU88_006741 [Pleurodeles waltl]